MTDDKRSPCAESAVRNVAAGIRHEPFHFDQFPDDAETLSYSGLDTYSTTTAQVSVHDHGVRITVNVLGSTVTIDLPQSAATKLAALLSDAAKRAHIDGYPAT